MFFERIDADVVLVETADKTFLTLGLGDPKLSRLNLAYSLNMHMAQGFTTGKAITAMLAEERYRSILRLFDVSVTRVRGELVFIVDGKEMPIW